MESFEESVRRRLRSSEQAIKSFSIVLKSWYFRKTEAVLTVLKSCCVRVAIRNVFIRRCTSNRAIITSDLIYKLPSLMTSA